MSTPNPKIDLELLHRKLIEATDEGDIKKINEILQKAEDQKKILLNFTPRDVLLYKEAAKLPSSTTNPPNPGSRQAHPIWKKKIEVMHIGTEGSARGKSEKKYWTEELENELKKKEYPFALGPLVSAHLPLFRAIIQSNGPVVEELLKNGADTNLINPYELMRVLLSAKLTDKEIQQIIHNLSLLAQHGFDINKHHLVSAYTARTISFRDAIVDLRNDMLQMDVRTSDNVVGFLNLEAAIEKSGKVPIYKFLFALEKQFLNISEPSMFTKTEKLSQNAPLSSSVSSTAASVPSKSTTAASENQPPTTHVDSKSNLKKK